MGRSTGDQARYNKMRRKKIARRLEMRTLRNALREKRAGTPSEPRPA